MLFINDLLNKKQYIEVKNLLASAGKIGFGLNQEVYAVGGLLRDFLLGKNVNDIDLQCMIYENIFKEMKKLLEKRIKK